MYRIIRPLVTPAGRLILLSAATVWLLAAMALSHAPDVEAGAIEVTTAAQRIVRVEQPIGVENPLYKALIVASTSTGSLYVSDTGNGRVLQLERDNPGTAARVFGSMGQGPGEMLAPTGIAVDSAGSVFVADRRIGRITKYDRDGRYLASVTHPGAVSVMVTSSGEVLAWPGRGEALLYRYGNDLVGPEPLLKKTDIARQRGWTDALFALDRKDRLYWLDQQPLTVTVFDREMTKVKEWTVDPPGLREDIELRLEKMRERFPELPTGLNPILHMALSAAGDRLLLTYKQSSKTHALYVYTLEGELEYQRTDLGNAFSATLDLAGGLVIADGDGLEFHPPLSNSLP